MSSEEEIKSNLIAVQRLRIAELKEGNNQLEEENKRLRLALEVYADENNWGCNLQDIFKGRPELNDFRGFQIALDALNAE